MRIKTFTLYTKLVGYLKVGSIKHSINNIPPEIPVAALEAPKVVVSVVCDVASIALSVIENK